MGRNRATAEHDVAVLDNAVNSFPRPVEESDDEDVIVL